VTFAYRPEFLTETFARALERRGWTTIPSERPGELLLSGAADIVMTPALDYGQHLGLIDYALVPTVGIMTTGIAGLTKVAFNKGLKGISSLAVRNPESSEALLARILFAEKHDIDLKLVPLSGDASPGQMLERADGALLVGDEASIGMGSRLSAFDLSDEWEDLTESPLPYMLMWGRVGEVSIETIAELLEARDEAGLSLAAAATGHPAGADATAIYEHYLRGDIRFTIGLDDLDSLDTFYRYAFYHTAIPDIPSIRFLPDGEPPPGGEKERGGVGEGGSGGDEEGPKQ
jgi:predicted solute-binding protein